MAERRSKKKQKLADLPGQPDPAAPLDSAQLLAAAQPVLKLLDADLLKRAKGSAAITQALADRHEEERKAERTADGFAAWQKRFVEQVSAAWLLSCVFARALEDRGLARHNRIAGPGAADAQRLFFQLAPSLTERDYLLTVFRELSRYPAGADLFGPGVRDGHGHNPIWLLAPSAEACKALLALFRTPSADEPAFRFGVRDTRYLGDLYQDLNENVRKRYALLQTPDFVESFILDRTLEPAIERFGLDDTDLIDPTCGSGHFLLGAFDRLFEHIQRQKPGLEPRTAAEHALEKVHGADINPFAVAIARFRLTLSFLDKAGFTRIADAPELPLRVAVADSLLYNPQLVQGSLFEQEGVDAADWEKRAFRLEDEKLAREVLGKRYAAVVGNPPYITVKDKVLRERYRKMYPSAHGKYSLSVPFAERFFQLARAGGRVGQITANSFMKREFGKKLIEDYLPTVNLDLIVNTSGAYIPGHGTPTVLLFGSHEEPQGTALSAVLAKRGEPTTPDDPARGKVWSSIVAHWDDVGYDDDYLTSARVERALLAAHPWSLAGGGAGELKALLEERADKTLGDISTAIGFDAIMGEDELFFGPPDWMQRLGASAAHVRDLGIGENVRDWHIGAPDKVLFPYDEALIPELPIESTALRNHFWRYRQNLIERRQFGKNTVEAGLEWYEYRSFYKSKRSVPLSITFAFVATHNHFVLDRGGKVFNRSAPIIKLPETATEEDHLALLAYLNSSTACFWMKQVFFDKGNRGEGGGTTAETWEKFFEFDGTKLKSCPIPSLTNAQRSIAVTMARRLDDLAAQRDKLADIGDVLASGARADEIGKTLADRAVALEEVTGRIRAEQERLDWWVYGLFGLTDYTPPVGNAIAAGERASDVRFAQRVVDGDVGARYFELCRLPIPEVVAGMRSEAIEGALAAIGRSKMLSIIETPVYKRTFREGHRPLDLMRFIDGQLSTHLDADMRTRVAAAPLAALAAELRESFDGLLDYRSRMPGGDGALADGVAHEAVPYLAALCYQDHGLEKHAAWRRTWAQQRREDAGEKVSDIPVPPKYAQKDYRSATYWRLRGKLDVPKERFISYPGCESDEDGEPVYGWAGWDHEQRGKALATLYYDRKTNEGWDEDRLTPMLAGLAELLFWLELWHDEPSDDYGGVSPAAYYRSFVDGECAALGLTHDDLEAWRPPEKPGVRGRRRKG